VPIRLPPYVTTRTTGVANSRDPLLASRVGILQADAYGGYSKLYREGCDRRGGLLCRCQAQVLRARDVEGVARRKSRGQGESMIYPIALEAVQRLNASFDID